MGKCLKTNFEITLNKIWILKCKWWFKTIQHRLAELICKRERKREQSNNQERN